MQTFPEYTDSESTSKGAADGTTLCGSRTYSLSTISPTPSPASPSPIALNSATKVVTLDTDVSTHAVQTYTVTFKVVLDDYPSIELTETFTATINACVITGVTADTTLNSSTKTYEVANARLDIPITPYTIDPSVCTNY